MRSPPPASLQTSVTDGLRKTNGAARNLSAVVNIALLLAPNRAAAERLARRTCAEVRPSPRRAGLRRFAALGLAACLAATAAVGTATLAPVPARAAGNVSVTGLPLPRFVSLKASRVNVRVGPGNGYSTKWIFVRSGLPVEVIQEFENWRRIRDSSGEEGWVYWSLLSGKRTVLVSPWDGAKQVPLRYAADDQASVVAILDPNVVADVDSCDGKWCKIRGKGFKGYARQDALWGVYPDETVK